MERCGLNRDIQSTGLGEWVDYACIWLDSLRFGEAVYESVLDPKFLKQMKHLDGPGQCGMRSGSGAQERELC